MRMQETRMFVGHIVGWSLSGQFKQGVAQQRAIELGLDGDFKFPRVNENSVYRRAVNAAIKGARNDERQFVVKLVEDSASFIVHEFLSADVQDLTVSSLTDKSALFTHETCTRFDKLSYASGKGTPDKYLQVEDPQNEICAVVAKVYNEGAVDIHYSIADVRTAFQRAFAKWCGLSVLQHGGMWFIPRDYAKKVEAWEAFVNSWPGCKACVWDQYDGAQVMKELEHSSNETLEAQLAQVLTDLERFAASGNVRMSTLEARIEMFDELRARAELFERLLGSSMVDIKDKMNSAKEALVAAVAELSK